MAHLLADYGTDHWYEADGYFTAGRPPWQAEGSPLGEPRGPAVWQDNEDAARAHALAAYKGMNRTDPDAVWYYQGWILGGAASPFTKGLTSAVEPGRLVISDMRCEMGPDGCIWTDDDGFSFYGAQQAPPRPTWHHRLLHAEALGTCPQSVPSIPAMSSPATLPDTPFVWGVLHNFGGVLGMWGSLPQLNTAPFEAFANASSVAGIGAFPEGMNQNSIYYTFLYDVNWCKCPRARTIIVPPASIFPARIGNTGTPLEDNYAHLALVIALWQSRSAASGPVDVHRWVDRYAVERYGFESTSASKAWRLLASSVYAADQGPDRGNDRESASDGLTSYPLADEEHVAPKNTTWYNRTMVWEAWSHLVTAAGEQGVEQGGSADGVLASTMNYDLVNVGREALAKLSNDVYFRLLSANNSADVRAAGASMVELQHDADRLLCSDKGFSMAAWVASARAWGSGGREGGGRKGNQRESDLYEWQARAQVTSWLPACRARPTSNTTHDVCGSRSDLADYSNKQWGGLVGSYYPGRYKCYVEQAASDFAARRALNYTAYNLCLDNWAWEWQNDVGDAPAHPICDTPLPSEAALQISRALLAKYWAESGVRVG